VDYTLAPDAQFPTQIDECYQVYRWALRNALRLGAWAALAKKPDVAWSNATASATPACIGSLGSSAQRIILVGDSAGGNIVTDIVLRVCDHPRRFAGRVRYILTL